MFKNTPLAGFLPPFPSNDLGKEEFIRADRELMTMSETSGAMVVVVGRDMSASR